jgi:hypothetical protein
MTYVLMVVTMKMAVFWVVVPCRLVDYQTMTSCCHIDGYQFSILNAEDGGGEFL